MLPPDRIRPKQGSGGPKQGNGRTDLRRGLSVVTTTQADLKMRYRLGRPSGWRRLALCFLRCRRPKQWKGRTDAGAAYEWWRRRQRWTVGGYKETREAKRVGCSRFSKMSMQIDGSPPMCGWKEENSENRGGIRGSSSSPRAWPYA
jgi:hypothetical protein